MIALELTQNQRGAVEMAFDRCAAIEGAPGTGKTTALRERIARARAVFPDCEPLIFSSPSEIDSFAVDFLRANGAPNVRRVDDVEAEALFSAACAPLFALEWEEFSGELDPEVPGLRSPDRFLESSFRLFRKLRDALVSPEEFLRRALAGATEFTAKPPNFADPGLLFTTKHEHHDSLDVSPMELQRQYRREIDLAKILTKLYRRYDELTTAGGRMTGRDAVARAVDLLRGDARLAGACREGYRTAFVDAAEHATPAKLALLEAIFGRELDGVTVATAVKMRWPATASIAELREQHRSPPAIDIACRFLTQPAQRLEKTAVEPALELFRARLQTDEAEFIATRVAAWLEAGTPSDRIAILLRSVRHAEPYERALLDRGIPLVAGGDVNVFADRRSLDALALLWNVHDPFRHDWMLRTLGNPALGLSDASLAALCTEPPHPQAPLFAIDDEPAPTVRSSRWDPKRDLRLGWNVVRGEQDAALRSEARTAILRFRRLREGWLAAMPALAFEDFVRLVWREGLAREGPAGSARALAQQAVLQRLLSRLVAFRADESEATFADVLAYAERRTHSELESCEYDERSPFVRLMSVEAAHGLEFDRVVVANVRAGAFPRWYVPDAFLFSPRAGMIPKENVGDARAARTAKFSYYMYRNKPRERYNEQERIAFVDALRRARLSAVVTAFGPATRGVTAPEFLEELRNAHLPGTQVE